MTRPSSSTHRPSACRAFSRHAPLLLAGTLLAALACHEAVGPRPLDVWIEASTAAVGVGEPVSFLVDAQGPRLIRIAIRYGDGVTDEVTIREASTAGAGFQHVYSAAGTYQVTATALDAVAGAKEATLEVTVR